MALIVSIIIGELSFFEAESLQNENSWRTSASHSFTRK